MYGLCNYDTDDWFLWSSTISWYTDHPGLTLCFEYTVLRMIPLTFLCVGSIFSVIMLKKLPSIDYGCRGTVNIVKSILIVLLLYVHIMDLCFAISESISGHAMTRAMFVVPIISVLSSVLLLYINRLTFRKAIHSSGILFVYWGIQLIATTICTISTYQMIWIRDTKSFVIFANTTELMLVFISFLLSCFSDTTILNYKKIDQIQKSTKNILPPNYCDSLPISPEIEASVPSILTFQWFNGLLYRGYKRPVTSRDLYCSRYEDTCEAILPRFYEKWNKEIRKIEKKQFTKKAFNTTYGAVQSNDELDMNNYFSSNHTKTHRKSKSPSLIRTLFTILGYKYLFYTIVRVCIDLIIFVQPQLLSVLIQFIENTNDFEWHGYLIVFTMFAISTIRSVIYQHYNHITNVMGLRLRSGLVSFIYRKTLKLSPASRKNTALGEIINFMSVDSHKLTALTFDFHSPFSISISLVVGFCLLWQQLGIATLSGIILMICIIPLNIFLGIKVKKLQVEQMKLKDNRIKLFSEMVSGIKVFKLYAWEKTFEDRIQSIRNEECRILRLTTYLNSCTAITCFCAPYLIALSSFATFMLLSPDNILTASKAFVSLSLVNLLNTPMSLFPSTIAFLIQGYVSLKRINRFLVEDEISDGNVIIDQTHESAIEISSGNFSWSLGEEVILKNINLKIMDGELIAVVGNVGSGKSSLINAMLGEMNNVSGKVNLNGSVAYVPQQAWCQNASIQDNILFGNKMNLEKYQNVIDVCALKPDFEMVCDGDQSEVGEKGINLSGGQKQRISIARAAYHDASIYLFDDPLSAVDAHVNMHIFEKVIGRNGLLSKKTRIVVTHDISHLPNVDRIYFMKSGQILDSGTYETLLNKNREFVEYVRVFTEQMNGKMDKDVDVATGSFLKERNKSISDSAKFEEIQKRNHLRQMSSKKNDLTLRTDEASRASSSINRLIKDEMIEIGKVKLSVFLSYIRPATYRIVFLIFASFAIYLASSIAGNVFLSSWSEQNSGNHTQDSASRNTFLAVYGSLGVVQTVIILIENLCLAQGTFLASKCLHTNLLKTLVRVPHSFFETTPTGRILNRAGRDIDTVDINIPTSIAGWLITSAGVIGTVIVISIVTPYFILALIPLSFLYYWIQKVYITTNRQLKRLDSITRSPLYSIFHETVTGVTSIRAFGRSDSFIDRCDALIDGNVIPWYLNIVSFRWLQLNLEFIGNVVILFAGLFAVVSRQSIGAGLAGLSVSYALQITLSLNNMVRNTCDLESHIVSVERIEEYTRISEEAAWIIESKRPPFNWPYRGKVEFRNYSVRYRPDLNYVLKNLNLVVSAGEKLAIVGRTGAGKSSLALAIFRIIEATEGMILIDDVDVGQMGLHDLRSKITIIPQDPVLFSGTLRINLDPFSQYSDGEIWIALELAHLKSFASKFPEGLQYLVSENGDNLSVGQKQLLCLARASLKKTKILVMDEATAAIDLETDFLIQTSIRKQFQDCTVLTIAHRLNTIIDYDRILVLEDGRMKEIGSPKQLLSDKNSSFFSLARDSGFY